MVLLWPWPKGQGQIWYHKWTPQMWFPIDVQYISCVYLAPIRCYMLLKCDGTVYDLDQRSRSNLASPKDASHMVSYWCSIHFICLSCSNKALQATEMGWDCIWPWTLGQGQIWHYQWIPQMWFPIDVQYISYVYLAPIRCYRLLKCDGNAFDLDN